MNAENKDPIKSRRNGRRSAQVIEATESWFDA
jgi:hypothetical protein